jgi:tetratricopeptide (TPR) repeat protein
MVLLVKGLIAMEFRFVWMLNPYNSVYFKPRSIPENVADDFIRVDQFLTNNQWEEALTLSGEFENRIPERVPAEVLAYLQYLQGTCHSKLAVLKNPEENLSQATKRFEAAFPYYNDKNRLLESAIIQNNLGAGYRALSEYSQASRANLLTQANNALQTAQKLLEKAFKSINPSQNPLDYLRIVQNIGNTGNALAESRDAELNFEQVADTSRAALKMISEGRVSPESDPVVYGVIQYNIGYALNALAGIRGQKELRDEALAAYWEALQQHPVNHFPVEHTLILNQLAGIYIDMAEESGVEDHLNEAVKINKIVLEALTTQIKYPLGYACILFNLGRACGLYGQIRNRKDEYTNKARQYLESVLQIQDLPPISRILAATRLDLGMIYLETAGTQQPETYLPKAAQLFTEAATGYSEHEYPRQYAMIQAKICDTYQRMAQVHNDSMSGPERIEILELAQKAQEETVRILAAFSNDLAFRQNQSKLANIFLDLAKLNRQKEPVQKAILLWKELLDKTDANANPFDYADFQTNLGDCYAFWAELEDDPVNVNRAIETYESVLKIHTPDLFPLEHAKTLLKIGMAYREFAAVQNKEGNLVKALNSFQTALKYCPTDKYPIENATVNQEYGNTLLEMAELNNSKNNYALATQAFESAVKVFTFEKYPQNFAEIQITLGHCFLNIYRIEGGDLHLQKARTAFETALKYYTYEHFPYHFGSIMNDLGITMDIMAKSTKAIDFQNQSTYQKYVSEKITNTIGAYESALTVFTLTDYPDDYAQVQVNLGITYSFWAGIQNKFENTTKAIHAFEEALKIYTPEKHPSLYRQVNAQLVKEKQRIS